MTHSDVLNPNPKYATLGFGLMRLPSAADTTKMADAYLNAGFNYFDTAYVYGGSEDKFKRAVSSRHPRDSYLVADKLPPWQTSGKSSSDRILRESLKRCGLDYFDFYLVHSLDDSNERSAVSAGVYEWAAEQKKKGLCKHVGFSFHGTPALLERVLTRHPEMEFAQLQLNYYDILRDDAGQLHQIALKHKKPIIVMEPVRGGRLATLPKAAESLLKARAPDASIASWAVRYAASLRGATCVLSGMSNMEQMQDNLKTFSPFQPLTDSEEDLIKASMNATSNIAAIPCTSCNYCLANCPASIMIPDCFNLYNEHKRGAPPLEIVGRYRALPNGRKAEDCTACGACVQRCPQHIDIPAELEKTAELFK
ncbi:MAG: aldo/keto reductase [Oscillospiraceae bacterium]|nr:aldo/keto reductase [Oscillospiraceae bacterium]